MCCVGQLQENAIQFTEEIPFDHLGYCPTVCLDNDGYIAMVWQSITLRKLNYVTGNIPNPEEPSITWPWQAPPRSYGYGYNPTVAISSDGAKVLEEHETNFAPYRCSLYYHTGILQKPPRQGQAHAPQQEQQAHQQEHDIVHNQPQEDEHRL